MAARDHTARNNTRRVLERTRGPRPFARALSGGGRLRPAASQTPAPLAMRCKTSPLRAPAPAPTGPIHPGASGALSRIVQVQTHVHDSLQANATTRTVTERFFSGSIGPGAWFGFLVGRSLRRSSTRTEPTLNQVKANIAPNMGDASALLTKSGTV